MRKVTDILMAFAIALPVSYVQANCYTIKDKDLKNECLAVTRDDPSKCYAISDKDLKNSCLARARNERSSCYRISDKDQKQRCLANFR